MPGTELFALSETQRDAVREVANIGAGHAATALSLMTGSKIMISVPTITVAPLEELVPTLVRPDEPIAVVPMLMSGGLTGRTILAFPFFTAHRLAGLMLRREPGTGSALNDEESSALTEAGNILAGAYMTALSEFMHMTLLPSPPSLVAGPAQRVLASGVLAEGEASHRYVFCVETQFIMDHVGDCLPGYFLLLPDGPSLATMLAAVRVDGADPTD